MRTKIDHLLRGASVLFSDVVICALAIHMILILLGLPDPVAVLPWCGWLLAQFLIGSFLIQSGSAVNWYLIFQGVASIAGSTLVCCLAFFSGASPDLLLLLALCALGTGIHAGVAAWRLPSANGISIYGDILIVELAFYLWAVSGSGYGTSGFLIGISLGTLALDLLTVGHIRTGEESGNVIRGTGIGGRAALCAVLLLCLSVTGGAVGLASGQIHSVVDLLLAVLLFLGRILNAIFTVIGTILGYIILFFVAILPTSSQAAQEQAMQTLQDSSQELMESTGASLPAWILYLILAALALALVVYVLHMMRGKRFQPRRPSVRRQRIVRKSHLGEELLRLWRRAADRVRFEWNYRRYRKTPEGLFVLAGRCARGRKLVRADGESPGAFLRRIGESLPEDAAELTHLAELLDRVYYGGQICPLSEEEYRKYTAIFRKLM